MLKIYEYLYQINDNEFKPINTILDDSLIFLNGIEEYTDYTIDEETGIILTNNLLSTDYLVLKTSNPSPIAIGDYGNVPYKRYNNANMRLKYNQIYYSNIQIPTNERTIDIKLNFTSRYNPFYCSNKLIKEDIGNFVTLSDEDINFIIYDNSVKVLVEKSVSGKLNYDLPVPYELQDPLKIPYNIQQYVRYMSDLDILNAAYRQLSGMQGVNIKRLGDMQIQKDVKLPLLKDLLADINDKLNKFPLTASALAKSVVKGSGTDTWPVSSPRRSF